MCFLKVATPNQKHEGGPTLNGRLRRAFASPRLSGNYALVSMVRMILTLLWVGGRRLRHIDSILHDPMVRRLARLRIVSHERTLSRWLKQFSRGTVLRLAGVNTELVSETLRTVRAQPVTLDIDGSSYYPKLARVAQTGQILAVNNGPGNVSDGKYAQHFLRDVMRPVRAELGAVVVECRLDEASFQCPVLATLEQLGVEYAIKVPMYQWLGLNFVIRRHRRWKPKAGSDCGSLTSRRSGGVTAASSQPSNGRPRLPDLG